MIKKVMIVAMSLIMSIGAMAQSVTETVVTVGTLTVPAVTITMEQEVDLVQNAMRARLKEAGLKTTKSEGYVAALEQVFAEISASPISFFTKVEEQGRRNNKVTVVTVCAVPTDLTQNQSVLTAAVRSFLEKFPQYVDRFQSQKNLEQAMEVLKKAEKAAASAVSDVNSIDKGITQMQGKITDKRNEIERLRAKIQECETEIAELEKKIEKERGKRSDAQRKVDEANAAVSAAQAEVDRYRQMAQ